MVVNVLKSFTCNSNIWYLTFSNITKELRSLISKNYRQVFGKLTNNSSFFTSLYAVDAVATCTDALKIIDNISLAPSNIPQPNVTQCTYSYHVVCESCLSKYHDYSISNRHGHQPSCHDTRLHAHRSLEMIRITKSQENVRVWVYIVNFNYFISRQCIFR